MLSPPSLYKSRNPYLVKYDGKTAVFQTPLRRTLQFLFLGGCCMGIYFGLSLNVVETWYEKWVVERHDISGFENQLVFLAIASIPSLWVGGICILASGRSKISFDLQRRTYRRVVLAPPPVIGKRGPDTIGWGNPLIRRILNGPMSNLDGVQIVEREEKISRIYSVYVVPVDKTVPSCVVYYATSLQDAEAQMHQIASLLSLPALETLSMDALLDSNRAVVNVTPGDFSVKPRSLGSYWIERGARRAAFATPLRYLIFMHVSCGIFLVMAFFSIGYGIDCAITHPPKADPIVFYSTGTFWLAMGSTAFTNTGVNRITFDLERRVYERRLFGPALLEAKAGSTGLGNRFQRTDISGSMHDIAGVHIVGRPIKTGKVYAVQLQWAGEAQPPMTVGMSLNRREANEQAAEIASVLSLPVLEIADSYSWG